ncbi:ABC transporter substrate-binding protein [Streptomyces sp. ST2-7A]|uniref:ABC transporter substrate-binding protein n=1 Tax=Streptomyces sp. ST2-7A TaxID=2907214 RepID=UPI001F24B4D2|nr:ABC transporter substrate-binding protein [Streptomyces sp. ST2-7A]MCE7080821.1 ABC transporter substrate-binding protein [Streptomyces sp. ST2-7A]
MKTSVRARSALPRTALVRRSLPAAIGVLCAGALLTACAEGNDDRASGGDPASEEKAEASEGAWSFTDDRGVTVELDSRPETVVAFVGAAAALHDYGVTVDAVFGPLVGPDGEPDIQAGDLPVNELESVGSAWGEFNLDAYAALEPDLLVSTMFVEDALWYVPDDSAEKIESLAPGIGLSVASPSTVVEAIDRHAELAEALGGDLSADTVTEDKERFEAAAEELRQAVEDNPGIRVMAASGSADLFYVSDPKASPDLSYFAELGVEMVVPDEAPAGFFEELSWENADRYDADIILLDGRTGVMRAEDLADKPTWAQLPAVKADQIAYWTTEPRYSHAGFAPILEALAEAIRDADRVA